MSIVIHNKRPQKRSCKKKNLYKLLLARSDITAALNACNLMMKNVDGMGHDLYYPLYSAIVVCYARPFTNNKPYGSLPKKWQKFNNPEYQDANDKLIKARHELIAHSDMNVRKAMIVPPGVVEVKLGEKDIKSPHIGTKTSFYAFPVDFFKTVYDTAKDLGSRINNEIEMLVIELYEGMELPAKAFPIKIDDGL